MEDLSNPCLVLDITDAHSWEAVRGYKRIEEKNRPSALQPSLPHAQEEAKRLGRMFPGRTFGVFQITCAAIPVRVPSRISFSGEALEEQVSSALVEVGPDPIPF